MTDHELSNLLQEWKRTPAPSSLRERVFTSRRLVGPRWWDRIPGAATALSGIAAGGLVAWGLIALSSTQWREPVAPAPVAAPQQERSQEPPRVTSGPVAAPVAPPKPQPRVKQVPPARPPTVLPAPVAAAPVVSVPTVGRPAAKTRAFGPVQLLEGQQPVLPAGAAALAIKTSVTLRIRIGKDGSVLEATVIDGDPVLNDIALETVKDWRYRPYLLNGEPAERTTDVVVDFQPKPKKIVK